MPRGRGTWHKKSEVFISVHPDLEGKSDDELVALALSGSQGAMEELYERYRVPLMGYAYRLTGERGLAEDVFQNTFTYFFERLDRYEPRGKLSPYLFRIAHSYAADESVAARKHRRLSKPDPLWAYTAPPAEESDEAALLEAKVRSAMEGLSVPLREVVELRLYQGLDYPAIAAITGVSEATARSRLRYALEALRDTMGVARRPDP